MALIGSARNLLRNQNVIRKMKNVEMSSGLVANFIDLGENFFEIYVVDSICLFVNRRVEVSRFPFVYVCAHR